MASSHDGPARDDARVMWELVTPCFVECPGVRLCVVEKEDQNQKRIWTLEAINSLVPQLQEIVRGQLQLRAEIETILAAARSRAR